MFLQGRDVNTFSRGSTLNAFPQFTQLRLMVECRLVIFILYDPLASTSIVSLYREEGLPYWRKCKKKKQKERSGYPIKHRHYRYQKCNMIIALEITSCCQVGLKPALFNLSRLQPCIDPNQHAHTVYVWVQVLLFSTPL